MQLKLSKMGYIENTLIKTIKINDTLWHSKIKLNTRITSILIYFSQNEISKSILKDVSNNYSENYFELPINSVKNSLEYINSKMIELGLPFSKLKLNNIKKTSPTKLQANLTIIKRHKNRTVDDIIVKGYKKFPKSYLKHFLKLKKHQVFDLKNINKKTKLLDDLRFADQIKSPEILFSKDSTSLYLYINKSQSNTFDGFLGFGTNEETNKLDFNGYLNLNLTNNLNYGETFKLLYKGDENNQKTFEANLTLPYLFKTPIGVDLQLNIFRRDTTFSNTTQSAKIHYQINSKHKIYTGVSNTKSDNLLVANSSSHIKNYSTNYYSFSYYYLKPQYDNLLFPFNSSLFLDTNFGKRENNQNSEKQYLMNLEGFKIINLNNKNSLYLRVNGSILQSNTYFENELLRFGGINSIRGFEENSILASKYGVINSEYRYQLNKSIYIHSVTDVAYFENKLNDSKEKLFGYGFGFGLLTKSGLLKLNYVNGKTEKQNFKLSNSKIHISLKTRF
ncbi:POTRA domain-containing protein [Postechiella marina]